MHTDADLADLADEDSIVWTEDVQQLDYVREYVDYLAKTRRSPVLWAGQGRRVGYSVLRADAEPGEEGRFTRRVFWLKGHDRSEDPDGTYKTTAPAEAVDPRTVAPRTSGVLTERAWGAPLPA